MQYQLRFYFLIFLSLLALLSSIKLIHGSSKGLSLVYRLDVFVAATKFGFIKIFAINFKYFSHVCV